MHCLGDLRSWFSYIVIVCHRGNFIIEENEGLIIRKTVVLGNRSGPSISVDINQFVEF